MSRCWRRRLVLADDWLSARPPQRVVRRAARR